MKALLDWLEENRCALVLFTLFALLLTHPFLVPGKIASVTIGILGSATIFFAIYAIAESRHHFFVALILGLFAIITTWGAAISQTKAWFLFSDYSDVLFYAFLSVFLLRYVLGKGLITADKLCAAIAIYLILGLLWGRLYHAIALTNEGPSFAGPAAPAHAAHVDVADTDVYTYFSFVTLTTLGYGDMVPLTPLVRTLAFLEAAVGVLFLAVLVARLVSRYGGRRPRVEED